MAEGLLTALERVGALAREIRDREGELDEAIRQASRLGGSCRQIAALSGVSAATVNRRLTRRLLLTPEDAERLVAARAEQVDRRLTLAKMSLAKRRLRLGEPVDLEAEVGDVDALVVEAIHAADGIEV